MRGDFVDPKKLQAHITQVRLGSYWSRVVCIRFDVPLLSENMIPQKTDALTCVLVVTAALLLGFVRCNGCLSKAP
jgi:hypothetical protein